MRIAQFHARPGCFRKLRFEIHDLFRIGVSFVGRFTKQRQHLGHVRHIRVAQFFRSVVRLRVIIAVRHSEPTLHRLRDLPRAVLIVLSRSEIEERVHAIHVQMRDFLQHILSIFDAVDLCQLVLQRFGPHRFNRFLVHPARVIIANFFRNGVTAFRLRRFLRDRVERVVVVLDQNVKAAPARLVRRNLRALDPTAVRVKKEIVRRLDRYIHVRRINRLCVFIRFRFGGSVSAAACDGRRICFRFLRRGRRLPGQRRFLRFSLRLQSKRDRDS